MESLMTRRSLARLMVWCTLIVGLIVLGRQIERFLDSTSVPLKDFAAYWSAGRLNATGGNPYDSNQLLEMKSQLTSSQFGTLSVYNPPWALALFMPLGLVEYPIAWILWLTIHFGLLLFCIDWFWRFYGGPTRYRWLAWLIGIVFLPSLVGLKLTQLGPIILLGIVGFLHFDEKKQFWLAGASVVLIAIKPQRVYLFWIALLFWVLEGRRWAVLLGAALAVLTATMISVAVNPDVIGQYINSMSSSTPPWHWQTPTLGAVLRLLFGIEKSWLQFLPPVLGTVWFLFYWRKHHKVWLWAEQMPVLLLVSLTTTSFVWVFDQVVLLAAVIQASVWVFYQGRRSITWFALAVYLGIMGFGIGVQMLKLENDLWFAWLAPALLLTYLVVRNRTGGDTVHQKLKYRIL